jgi:hypothetical protein
MGCVSIITQERRRDSNWSDLFNECVVTQLTGCTNKCAGMDAWAQEVCQATELRTPEQLAQRIAKGAGCSLPCLGLLPCQHPCPLSCHPFEHDKVKCARIVRVDCAAGSHRVEKACCEAQAPPCREPVVEHCEELGHPLVRQCCASPVCGICRVLEAADRKRDAAEAVFTKKVEALLIALAAHAAHPPQGGDASSSSATAAVSPSLKNESIMSKMKGLSIGTASAISKSSTPASTNPEEDVARNGELSELMEEHAAAKTKLERALRADLDRATARAGNEVADAIRRLQLNHEQNQERMQVRDRAACASRSRCHGHFTSARQLSPQHPIDGRQSPGAGALFSSWSSLFSPTEHHST